MRFVTRPERTLLLTTAVLLLTLTLAATSRPSSQTSTSTAFVDATVVPMTTPGVVLRRYTVVVRGERILEMGPADAVQVPSDARIVDGRGKYLIPGLIDFHVHLRDLRELEEYLRHGVTTVVSMRATETTLMLRERVRAGTVVGPRILTAGPLVDGDPPIWSGTSTLVVASETAAEAAADAHCRNGYDFLKVYNNLQPDLLPALTSRAHDCGIPVAAHLPRQPMRDEGLERGLAGGIDLIAHAEEIFFTHLRGASDARLESQAAVAPMLIDEAVRLIARANAAVTPNLSFVAMTARLLENAEAVFRDPLFDRLAPDVQTMWREQNPSRRRDVAAFAQRERIKRPVLATLTRSLQEAGILLLAGTDASAPGMYPGRSLHLEITELMASGLTAFESLAAATSNAGQFFASHPPGGGRNDLRDLARLGVGHRRPQDRLHVDAVVLPEPVVLDGDDGVEQVLGQLGEPDVDPVLLGLEPRDQPALGVEDLRGLVQGRRRQRRSRRRVGASGRDDGDQCKGGGPSTHVEMVTRGSREAVSPWGHGSAKINAFV